MFGLLKSVTEVVVDVADLVSAPLEAGVDLLGAAIRPFKEAAEELKQDIKSLKD